MWTFYAHAEIGTPITVCHGVTFIKGHQNKRYPMALSRTAWLNIEADLAAKSRIGTSIKQNKVIGSLTNNSI